MTVNTTNITSGPYSGNDVADTFSYTFRVKDKTQITIYETNSSGVVTVLTVDTDYTVAGVGNDAGGTITRTAGALPTGYTWYIRANYPKTQLTAFQSQGAFFPELHEDAIDQLTFLVQQLCDKVDRSPRLTDYYGGTLPLTMADPSVGLALRWNGAATGIENYDPSTVSNEEISADKPVINYSTLNAAVVDTSLKINQACNIKERTLGGGGGGIWDVVLAATVVPNGFDIVVCTGVPTLALMLRIDGVVYAKQLGAGTFADDTNVLLRCSDLMDLSQNHTFKGGGGNYTTTSSIIFTASDAEIDWEYSTINNTSNSLYACCLCSANIVSKTESDLLDVMLSLNYGSEIRNSKIRNLIVNMSPITAAGANLGTGIVYGLDCELEDIITLQTNGNITEIRNSTRCKADNVVGSGRGFGLFFFQTRDCSADDCYITDTLRGIVVKHSQAGDPVDFVATRCVIENLNDTIYYTVGGTFLDDSSGDPIYQTGHEKVENVTFRDCTFRDTNGNTAKGEIGYFASDWHYENCHFESDKTAGLSIGSTGSKGSGDPITEPRGQNHKISGGHVNCGNTIGNVPFSGKANYSITDVTFNGAYTRIVLGDSVETNTVDILDNTFECKIQEGATGVNYPLNAESSEFNIRDNTFILTTSPNAGANWGVARFPTKFIDNSVTVDDEAYANDITVVTTVDGKVSGNTMVIDCDGIVYCVTCSGEGIVTNNEFEAVGTLDASSRCVNLTSSSVEVGAVDNNVFKGTWPTEYFASLSKNLPFRRELKSLSAAPTTGTWARGDIVFNSSPAVGQPSYWQCTVAGTPGTWVAGANL